MGPRAIVVEDQSTGDGEERCQRLLRILMSLDAASDPPSYADVAVALEMPIGAIGPTRGRCLAKPFTSAALARAVREALGARNLPQAAGLEP